jgi:hypothetical protein
MHRKPHYRTTIRHAATIATVTIPTLIVAVSVIT